jgi:multidrug transporter EmrE-like cation transporter
MTNALLFAGYTTLSVLGLVLMRLGLPAISRDGFAHASWASLLETGAGATLYLGAFALWLVILSRIELSVAYPVAIGLTLVLVSASGAVLLKESVDLIRVVGIVLILAGISLVASRM